MRIEWVINFLKRIGIIAKDLKSRPNVIPGISGADKKASDSRTISPQALDQILTSEQSIANQIKTQNTSLRFMQLTNIGFPGFMLTPEHIEIYDLAAKAIESRNMHPGLLNGTLSQFTTMQNIPAELFKAICITGLHHNLNSVDKDEFQHTNNLLITKVITNKSSLKLLELYLNTYSLFMKNDWPLKTSSTYTGYNIFQIFQKMTEINLIENMINTLNKDILSGYVKDWTKAVFLLKEIAVHSAACIIHESKDQLAKQKAADYIRDVANNDHAPYEEGTIEAEEFHKETQISQNRMFQVYHGFGALTFEAKRRDQNSHWLLARFGNDIAEKTHYLYVKDPNKFPGGGVMISGVILESMFAQDEKEEDPFRQHKEAWPWAKTAIDEIRGADFFFTRGFIAISCPVNERFQLDGVHYTYVVCNDHFNNHGLNTALLVPTKPFYKKISGCAIPFDEFLYFSPDEKKVKGLDEAGFLPDDFVEEALKLGINVLKIGGGTCVGGGLCDAYLPDSKPYHEWEKIRRGKETQNYRGHIHKSHKEGTYIHEIHSIMNRSVEPLRQAHRLVHKVVIGYQNIFDVFRLMQAAWHKGFTLGKSDLEQDETVDLVQVSPDEDFSDDPAHLLMLEEAYSYHRLKEAGITDRNKFPILVICDALDWWKIPDIERFLLDTETMIAYVGEQTVQLSKDKIGQKEIKFWYNNVFPVLARNSRADIRFYDRRELITDHLARR